MYLSPVLAGLAAALGTFATTPLVIRLARSRGVLCMPGARRIHNSPVPRLGGVAILAGASTGLGTALLTAPWAMGSEGMSHELGLVLVGMVAGGALVFAVGLVDDIRGARPATKLAIQLIAALIVFSLGFRIEALSWADSSLTLGWLALPFTVFWIVGVTNAYNLVDGMDGLATGMGLVAFAATAAAAAVLGHVEVMVVAAILFGALLGFLPHNFNPARIFMGDSGSLFVGFVLAVLSVQGSMKSAMAVLVAVPLFALAIPLLDTLVSIARRWLRGMAISSADARHIHHRLLALGFSHRDAVLVLYLVAVGFAGLGILLAFAPGEHITLIAIAGGIISAAVLIMGMRRLGYDEFLLAGKVVASGPRRARQAIRERILATDLAQVLTAAGSMNEIQAVLDDAADDFGFLSMKVCLESDKQLEMSHGLRGANWKLDFPLCDHAAEGDHAAEADHLVLRIRARIENGSGPRGAERAAHALGPVLAARLDRFGIACGPECQKATNWSENRRELEVVGESK